MPSSIQLGHHPVLDIPTRELVEVGKHLEAIGVSSLWLSDMLGFHNPFAQLSAVAMDTETLRLGPGCTSAIINHPVVTGSLLAGLTELAPKRVEVAVCTGNPRKFHAYNIKTEIHERIEAVRDTISIWRRLFEQKPMHYEGKYYTAKDFALQIPVHGPIPIYIAGSSPVSIRLAGELADGMMIDAAPLPAMPNIIKYIHEGAQRSNRDIKNFKILGNYAFGLDHTREKALDQARAFTSFVLLTATQYYLSAAKVDPKRVEAVRQAYPDLEAVSDLITPEIIQSFAIAGTPTEVIEQFTDLNKAGMQEFTLIIPNDRRERILKLLETEVIPSLP